MWPITKEQLILNWSFKNNANIQVYIGPVVRKHDCCMQTTKAQTSLRTPAVWSVPLFFSKLESMISNSGSNKISMFQLVSAVDQAGLSMTRSETQKTGFLRPRLIFDYMTGSSQVGDGIILCWKFVV